MQYYKLKIIEYYIKGPPFLLYNVFTRCFYKCYRCIHCFNIYIYIKSEVKVMKYFDFHVREKYIVWAFSFSKNLNIKTTVMIALKARAVLFPRCCALHYHFFFIINRNNIVTFCMILSFTYNE